MSCSHLTKLNPAAPQRGKLGGDLTSVRKDLVTGSNRQVCQELWLKAGKISANKNTPLKPSEHCPLQNMKVSRSYSADNF